MQKLIETIKNLPKLISFSPATEEEIIQAENQLNLTFAEDYKVYLRTFGAILAMNKELTGIAKAKHRQVVFVTEEEREINNSIPKNFYVIENIAIDGIIIWQDNTGAIYQTSPNSKPTKIADSLNSYILSK